MKRTYTYSPKYSAIVAKKRKANPKYKLYVSPKLQEQIYKFSRHLSQNIALRADTGFSGVGFDMTLQPNLAFLDVTISGSTAFSPAVPNVSEFTALFDQYRIKKVSYELFFSLNNSNSQQNWPNFLIHCVNDYNSNGSFALTDIEQMPEMRTYQAGTNHKVSWYCYPHARADVLTITGISSTSAWNVKSPWLDTTSTNVAHLGTRIYLNNQGRSTLGDIGTVTIQCTYDLEFKFVK